MINKAPYQKILKEKKKIKTEMAAETKTQKRRNQKVKNEDRKGEIEKQEKTPKPILSR